MEVNTGKGEVGKITTWMAKGDTMNHTIIL